MTKWEYCRVTYLARDLTEEEERDLQSRDFPGTIAPEVDLLGTSRPTVRIGSIRFLSQPREDNEVFTDLGLALSRLGNDGWELVSHAVLGGNTDIFLKRSLPVETGTAEQGSNPIGDYRG